MISPLSISSLLALVDLLPPGELPPGPVLLDGGEGLADEAVALGGLVLATVATVGDLGAGRRAGWGGGQGREEGGVGRRAGYRRASQITWLHLAQGSSESLQNPQFPQPSSGSLSLAENSARSLVW